MKKVHTTACPRNCYSTCSFKVWTDDGKVVNIDPEPLNKATPEGICLKGLSYIERVNSSKRILHPLKKVTLPAGRQVQSKPSFDIRNSLFDIQYSNA